MGRKATDQFKTYKRKKGVVAKVLVEIDASQYKMVYNAIAKLGITTKQGFAEALHLWLNSLPKSTQDEQEDALLASANCLPAPFQVQAIKTGTLPWLKVFPEKWVYGSTGAMPYDVQLIWLWLLFLAHISKFRDGTLRRDTGQPFGRGYIAKWIKISRKKLDKAIELFKRDVNVHDGLPRVQEWEDGTLVITNFAAYQVSLESKRKGSNNSNSQEPETSVERELRERRNVRQGVKRYPEDAKEALQEHQESEARLASYHERVSSIKPKSPAKT